MLSREERIRLLIAALLGATLLFSALAFLCSPPVRDRSVWSDKKNVSDGYVLIAPYIQATNYSKDGAIHLIDKQGDIAHSWITKFPVLSTYLQPNGHVYAAMTPPINPYSYPSPGTTGLIQELDWDGNVVWEYSDSQMTHDFEIMPDGGVAYLRWSRAPLSFAQNVVGGMKSPTPDVWTNEIVVVNRDKEIVWTWKPEEHLNPRRYVLNPLIPRHDWAHLNSIRYMEHNPINGRAAFLISARHLNAVFMIDAQNGSVVWESPKEMFATQHDATLLENGNILVFDNGLFRNVPIPFFISRVAEVNPKDGSVVWQYPALDATAMDHAQFASSIMGSSQRLDNGNTLITESTANTVIEVDEKGKVVWSYTEYFRDEDGPRVFFKARKYSPEGTEWGTRVSSTDLAGVCRAI